MVATITGSVGDGGINRPEDVKTVQTLLARHASWLTPAPAPAPTGICDAALIAAIKRFQADAASLSTADGRVDPNGFTLRRLDLAAITRPAHPIFAEGPIAHAAGSPSDADYEAAAKALDGEVAAIKAVSQVEVGVTGCWEETGRPRILFERHVFSELTGGEYNATHSDISNPNQGGYGLFSSQYPKLRRAAVLNEQAALKSASWGAYQIVGRYHAQAGFADVSSFVTAQMQSELRQLEAFVSFVRNGRSLLAAFKAKDWTTFARLYNGPRYADNDYDNKMAVAYTALAAPPPATNPTPPGQSGRPVTSPPGRPH